MRQPANLRPKIWLMTDERNDLILDRAVRKLPMGSGIVFRHYHLTRNARANRFAGLKKLARRHNHIILLADHPLLARKWGADGVHGRDWKRRDTSGLLHSAPVHDVKEIKRAKSNGAELFFLSPISVTRSHPNKRPMNRLQLYHLRRLCGKKVILLGGMNKRRFHILRYLDAHGWAAIDSLSK